VNVPSNLAAKRILISIERSAQRPFEVKERHPVSSHLPSVIPIEELIAGLIDPCLFTPLSFIEYENSDNMETVCPREPAVTARNDRSGACCCRLQRGRRRR